MRHHSLFAIGLCAMALAALVDPPALAQTANSTSTSASNANAGAASGSAATSGSAVLNQYTSSGNIPAAPTDITVRSAPQVFAPPVVLGGNICALGASGGVSWLGAGFAVGGSWESINCERRQQAALLFNMGDKLGARELLCQSSREVYEAQRSAGTPCVRRAEWEPKVAAQPTPILPPAPSRPEPQRISFNASDYPTGSECLNAAQAAGASLNGCVGKP